MILYAGNILSSHGYTPTFIETLAPKLAGRYEILTVSEKLSQPLRMLDMISAFNRHKKNLKLVLIDSYSMRAFWYTYVLAKLCRASNVPYIPILRGGGYPDRLESSPALCREVFGKSYRNISPSLYLLNHFRDAGFEVDYIPNFIPLENYKFREIRIARPRLLWVRSFHEIYNPLMAVEVLKRIRLKYEDATLCMVGPDKDGIQKKVEQKIAEEGLSDAVKITGKLSKKDWLALASDYDIFINTTNFDNHPVSVIEAMALGLPVASTDVGGIPFLVANGKEGLLSPAQDPEKFSQNIIRIIEEPGLANSLSVNGRKKAEEFDWEHVSKKWFELIDPLTNTKSEGNVTARAHT